jgi:anti-anti-sigma regulatory factor
MFRQALARFQGVGLSSGFEPGRSAARRLPVAAKLLQNSGGQMRMPTPNETVRSIMEASGFNSLLKLHDTEADELANLIDKT